jgi:peptidoglycan/LPS O-acetylase OafA/YrhL
MLVGAIGAILFHKKNRTFTYLFSSKLFQIIAWAVMALIIVNRFHVASVIDNELVSIVALIIIIGQITVKNRILNLSGNVFDFLGKVSYGMYVIHPLVIFAMEKAIGSIEINIAIKYTVVYGSIIGITVFLAYLSYENYEKLFLRLRHKYSVIRTSASKVKYLN